MNKWINEDLMNNERVNSVIALPLSPFTSSLVSWLWLMTLCFNKKREVA